MASAFEMNRLAFIIFVYVIAAIPFGRCISACFGVDICTRGSGNIGATNMTRVMGLGFGSVVFMLDFLKAAAPVFLAVQCCSDVFASTVGFVAVFAHVFSVYMAFKGGKGVAPMMGVYFVLVLPVFIVAVCTWGIFFVLFRQPFISSLIACFIGAVYSYALLELYVFLPILAGTVLIFIRHTSNVREFLQAR
ncbi:glycerol-3-phosphate acyltransferase [Neorickettsia sennetsu]|uniref:Glycerol-3-phosphate acyltransferase n=1 Tax=Ehrlichia sennetsu (strain ATCC VR-367 / Miyayama) TaxID=222891 RepID=PLSY_EHRS3|nr:glycerol-3-phosphate acyltransferase [Neorickettsia sennetsu]Q2GD32.1 RecName: Full=Glycerol-3-phosphate acyltransferase; AltName: Full=Acyl-PO4 G3P acyltransferase; AltName: Full=Acyl-phosphate--glycerol-3-phosphate acyltransferase; AltName: Full=G3P acyltransferase; Short=GPAT; AltName: Full=Lysophosphatidic acid synthase; Short=LPA synthase [Neorickettsia sennetsu str. Miyayama]ABD45799.1 putative membrane protein [Neorickettsia sennetsu str. Miyayama]